MCNLPDSIGPRLSAHCGGQSDALWTSGDEELPLWAHITLNSAFIARSLADVVSALQVDYS
jgi:hypothetical protein